MRPTSVAPNRHDEVALPRASLSYLGGNGFAHLDFVRTALCFPGASDKPFPAGARHASVLAWAGLSPNTISMRFHSAAHAELVAVLVLSIKPADERIFPRLVGGSRKSTSFQPNPAVVELAGSLRNFHVIRDWSAWILRRNHLFRVSASGPKSALPKPTIAVAVA